MFFKFFQEYSETTTIHGIRYVLEKGSSYFERFLWLIIVLCGIGLAILISILAYIQWKENPVLTSISTTGYPIEKVPFPAITICAQVMKYYCVVAEFEKYFLLAKFRGLVQHHHSMKIQFGRRYRKRYSWSLNLLQKRALGPPYYIAV